MLIEDRGTANGTRSELLATAGFTLMQAFNELVGFFKRYGDQYGFDYLMIEAQGYQESALNQAERSSAGAVGIMQMKPSSAREPEIAIEGIEQSAERNIEAGNKYLRSIISKYLNDPSLDPKNQTLFAFAAYNAGPNRLRQFRDKAKAMGLNPNIWFGNVENAAAAIVGRETVQYVSNVYKYFIAYSLVTHQMDENVNARAVIAPRRVICAGVAERQREDCQQSVPPAPETLNVSAGSTNGRDVVRP
ncbi:MAG: transglycosylase SLT domain-containing protein [Xanthobacteraceae bacterium]